MPLQKSEYACPRCEKGNIESQIVANLGQLICSVDGTHTWNDTMSFFDEKPKMKFKVEIAKNLPQENYTPMKVSVPIGLEAALQAKYGDKVSANVASILKQMLEGDILLIGQTDLDRIASKLGKIPTSSSELFGLIYALSEQVAEYKMIADTAQKDVKAYEGISVGRVIVDLAEQYAEAQEKARGADLPLKLWVERSVRTGIQENWF